MALKLHFSDNGNKINISFVISAYLSCSSYKKDQYQATLAVLDKVMRTFPADATPIIGSRFNASITPVGYAMGTTTGTAAVKISETS
jgi:hypothetical protein